MLKKLSSHLPVIILCTAVLVIYNQDTIELTLNPLHHDALKKSDVILYTTQWCSYCDKTRRFLQRAGVAFIEHDIEKSLQAYQQYRQLNGNGVPVIQIGATVVQGYDKEAIRQAIDALILTRQ